MSKAATKQDRQADDSNFSVLDPEKVTVRNSKSGFGQDIVHKDRLNDLFTMVTPPMYILNARLHGEGDLGQEFKSNDGKTVNVDERTKATFQFGIGIGDLDDDDLRKVLPGLKEDQRLCLDKIYQIGNNILGAVYDSRINDFMGKITEIEADVISTETELLKANNEPGITTEADVIARMETDTQLRERIHNKGRAKFIEKAKYKFTNPEQYDEDGNLRRADGSNKRLAVYMKRKVWKRNKEHAKKKATEMPVMPTNRTLKTDVRDNFPEIWRTMTSHYTWNPVKFIDAKTNTALTRPSATITTPSGDAITMEDPAWTPIPSSKHTLASLRLMFGVFLVNGNPGVKVMPCPEVYIFRQREARSSGIPQDKYSAFATGIGGDAKKRSADDAAFNNGEDKDADDSKRAKTEEVPTVPAIPRLGDNRD